MIAERAPGISGPNLPFVYFSRTFDGSRTGAQLYQIYNELYNSAREAVDRFITANPGQLDLHDTNEGDSSISYNLAMTTNGMVLVPRRSEGTMLRHQDGTEIGFVALNGTTLGGTMLVKNQGEWDTLRAKPEMLDSILAAIGIPKEQGQYKARV